MKVGCMYNGGWAVQERKFPAAQHHGHGGAGEIVVPGETKGMGRGEKIACRRPVQWASLKI